MICMLVCSEVRSWLWNTLEYPWTSRLAQLLAFFSLSMIVLSTLTFIISTADELQQGASNNLQSFTISHSIYLQADAAGNVKYPTAVYLIDLMDNFVTIFFSAEFITRFLICPRNDESANNNNLTVEVTSQVPFSFHQQALFRKLKFMKNSMNIVDLLSITPFYVSLLLGME